VRMKTIINSDFQMNFVLAYTVHLMKQCENQAFYPKTKAFVFLCLWLLHLGTSRLQVRLTKKMKQIVWQIDNFVINFYS